MNGLATRLMPGLAALRGYRRADLRADLVAGVSVAAVALPVGVAYAQLAGLPPAAGLYASILPLVAYALFGTSRQLIVGPDAATCAMIAASAGALAAAHPEASYGGLAVALAAFAGLFCIAASFLRLGAIADFLSKPILVGFLNGVALSIVIGQAGKLLGFRVESGGIVRPALEVASKIGQTHGPTLALGLGTLAVMLASRRWLPRWPAALVAMVVAAGAVALLGLDARGVAVLGEVPAGLPPLAWPEVPAAALPALLGDAAGLALVSFSSAMLTARSFAARNGYEIDVDREFAALGVANVASALSQGFAISGADSRTAMNDSAGGRTQVAGLVAAASIAAVLLFLTGPLRYVPVPALGAVLVMSALSLFSLAELKELRRFSRVEWGLAVATMLGVVVLGAIDAIVLAVGFALVRFVRATARPYVEELVVVPGLKGFRDARLHPQGHREPGVLMLRFNGPLLFFNAAHFRETVLARTAACGPALRWVVIDAVPVTQVDATGRDALLAVRDRLAARGVSVALAGRETEILLARERLGAPTQDVASIPVHATLRQALSACRAAGPAAPARPT
jgi:high affinity sulfate transporter 1